MKKKISLVVAVLVLVLGLAGCGNAKTVSYDKDTLIQSCDAVFDIIESGSITSDQITEMSDWNQGYLMAQFESQTGVQMEADTFATALEGWKASLEECGDYESHKDYEFEASSTGVTVTAPATFSDRSADLEFVFDENMTLESFTVNAHYGMSEILEKAGLNTLLGMGTVFVMLIFMSFIISLIKYVPALLNGTSKKKKEEYCVVTYSDICGHDKLIEYTKKELTSLSLAYAMTVHKLQGAGRKTVIGIIDNTHHQLLDNCMLYTLLTRAKKRCLLLAEPSAFLQCIRTSHNHRNTWLKSQTENNYMGE